MSDSTPEEFSGVLTRADSKSLTRLAVPVPEGTRALEIRFSFDPVFSEDKQYNRSRVERAVLQYLGEEASEPGLVETMLDREDLAGSIRRMRNLLNWNLYDPQGRFRGRWDWSEQGRTAVTRIGQRDSSPGFLDGPILPGAWHIVLEVHMVCTERCAFRLSLLAHPSDRVPALQHPPAAGGGHPEEAAGACEPAKAPWPGWLRGEMHAHSVHSDGQHTVLELARRAAAAGLDFVALTDHNTTGGLAEAGSAEEVLFLRGEELTTFSGHFCLYGVGETVPWHEQGRRLSIESIADQVRARGFLFSLAHPFQMGDPVCTGCRWPGRDPPPDRFDLMEVWTGRWTDRRLEIERAMTLWDQWWDRGLAPVAVAARDWHGPAEEHGRIARTVVAAADRGERAVLDALRRGAVYMTTGPWIDLRLHLGPRTACLAEGFGPHLIEPGQEAILEVLLDGPIPPGSVLGFFHNGTVTARRDLSGAVSRHELPVSRPGRYRVEIRAPGGELILLTNHLGLA